MNKLLALSLVFLIVAPAVMGFVYIKPVDVKFRENSIYKLNDYSYDPRVTSKKVETTVYLTPPQPPTFARGYPAYYPRGTARIQSVRTQYRPQAMANIDIKDVRPSSYDKTVYQAWLYDAESGYSLNLGQFQALEGNNAEMTYTGAHYFDAYDYVLVTREPANDIDPRPSNDEVLIGKIVQKDYHEPLPQLGKREQYGYSYYGN